MQDLHSLVTSLLRMLDLSGEVEVSPGARTVVQIRSDDGAALIGPNGEHLRALNSLARRMMEKAHGEEAANFLIDVNGHHEAQMEEVRQKARMLAQRARLFKHDVEMPPQSPYERLVVHELFADDPEIKTESAGEGKFRHIVLKYKA
jgi:spoIIIJ-associated protein